jgi:hypothetical protein
MNLLGLDKTSASVESVTEYAEEKQEIDRLISAVDQGDMESLSAFVEGVAKLTAIN